jgi:AcrR family transcriptional regulator
MEIDRPLRADAERSVRAILEAAEHVLAVDPGASVEQIAEAAGLARTTVHRRFASRQAIIDALAVSAKQELADSIRGAHLMQAPALVALHRTTEQVLRIKGKWRFTLGNPLADTSAAQEIWTEINDRCLELLARAVEAGLMDANTDLEWTRRVYYALMSEAINDQQPAPGESPDYVFMATRVVDTLLQGAGPRN